MPQRASSESLPTSRQDVEKSSTDHPEPPRSLIIRFQNRLERLRFKQDHRSRLYPHISRFLGYRPLGSQGPYEPLPFPPFSWLSKIPLKYETWISAWIGAFGGIMLIEAVMSTNTAFRDVYHAPIIFSSFGAMAVLLFASFEGPLAQPRNVVLGQFISALIATVITRLFALNAKYMSHLNNSTFHASVFVNGAVSTATALLGQQIIGSVFPPAGATALIASVQANALPLSWRYIPTILASTLIMLAWALIINNVGRRRYPTYWWHPEPTFLSSQARSEDDDEKQQL